MEQIKTLVTECDNNTYELSAQMIELKVIQGAVESLLERVDDIVHKGLDKDRGMTYFSINEIRNTVRLINLGFGPLFDQMNNTVGQLHNHSLELFDVVHNNKKADVKHID